MKNNQSNQSGQLPEPFSDRLFVHRISLHQDLLHQNLLRQDSLRQDLLHRKNTRRDSVGLTAAKTVRSKQRSGFTLLELLVAVSLMMSLMYAVTVIFSRVGTIINDTQNTLEMMNNLRSAKALLESDLNAVSVPLAPPRSSGSSEGYFCYTEGLGANYTKIAANGGVGFLLNQIAYNSAEGCYDSTVGDTDDILCFTAKAPANQRFRGRCGYVKNSDNNYVLDTIESEYAEICWFVRGTTLYRRVLLIIPDELLQERLLNTDNPNNNQLNHPDSDGAVSEGFRFYRFFDVSVRRNPTTGKLVANTLADLSYRPNRFGLWNNETNIDDRLDSPHETSCWYWLRLPTIQECCVELQSGSYFRATSALDRDKTLSADFGSGVEPSDNLPRNAVVDPDNPGIDFWLNPNPWNEVNPATGDLTFDTQTNPTDEFTQDVVLTNVIGFNVKVWNDVTGNYVDLGANPNDVTAANRDNDFRGLGFYANPNSRITVNGTDTGKTHPYLPAIYDTWTDRYEKEFNIQNGINTGLNQIPVNGSVSNGNLTSFPAPYIQPLRGLRVLLRVYDPKSRNIRNVTLDIDYTKKL